MSLSPRGDNQPYTCTLKGKNGDLYTTRFTAKKGYNSIKLPLNAFKSARNNKSPKGGEVVGMSFRYDKTASSQAVVSVQEAASKFSLSLEW